jgi:hypothetical protein
MFVGERFIGLRRERGRICEFLSFASIFPFAISAEMNGGSGREERRDY